SYYPGIERLISRWMHLIEDEGRVKLIYPFVGLIKTMLSGKPAKLHCGCGHFNHNICTDGTITACPVSSDFYRVFKIGSIFDSKPSDLVDAMLVGEPCLSCEIYSICGGRCLYANKLKPWGESGYNKVCETVFHLVNNLKSVFPKIRDLIKSGKISEDDFNYFQYNGAEIIP
ncbi:MAG: TIGR04084 family radical SAM/SPASM domain-containing protein, partial [Promethearchaeota archaeon]